VIAAATETVNSFIHSWSEQKLCDVLAFCEDGRMDFDKLCCCLLGVASSQVLHIECNQDVTSQNHHYMVLRRENPEAIAAEEAYYLLGGPLDDQQSRDAHLCKILRAELARREAARELAQIMIQGHEFVEA
jgi:hypothetical protein